MAEILTTNKLNADSIFEDKYKITTIISQPVSQPLYAHACGAQEIYKSDLKVHGTREKELVDKR